MENRALELGLLDPMMPMHLVVSLTGHIRHSGPTLQKLRPDTELIGLRFLELFEVLRPSHVMTMTDILGISGMKLHLQFRDEPRTQFKGVFVLLPEQSGVLLNLSFGIGVVDAVAQYRLTNADFAPNDLTIEMLYLVEAKSAAMEESRRLNSRLQGAMIAAEEKAYTDGLTGLKNRRALDYILDQLIERQMPFAVTHLDLDFFKAVNDTLGHAAGDHVLEQVARILTEETRSDDTVARVGGDEFVILYHKPMKPKLLEDRIIRIIGRLEEPIPFGKHVCRISGRAGTTLSSRYDTPSAAQVMEDADIALYASKHKGRACHTFYDPALRQGAANHSPPAGREPGPKNPGRAVVF